MLYVMNSDFCQRDVFQFLFRRGTSPDLMPVLCSMPCLTYKKG